MHILRLVCDQKNTVFFKTEIAYASNCGMFSGDDDYGFINVMRLLSILFEKINFLSAVN